MLLIVIDQGKNLKRLIGTEKDRPEHFIFSGNNIDMEIKNEQTLATEVWNTNNSSIMN